LHAILFYSANHNHDENIAEKISAYWCNEITDGKGACWNSNRSWLKHRYAEHGHGVGVGQIDWDDSEMREALRKNLIYLAKADQYLMIRGTGGVRTFDMSRMPKRIKSGRPRNALATYSSQHLGQILS
jgi:hypothetical protein